MDFRLELHIKAFKKQINIQDAVMLMGSCFTDHISKRLATHKFKVLDNPNGIIFNPISIQHAISSYIHQKEYRAEDLFNFNELWTSWDHHGMFAHPDQQTALANINQSITNAHQFLQQADWLILTLGSSFVYELNETAPGYQRKQVAANCHKVPQPHFTHRLLSYLEVEAALEDLIGETKDFNPNLNIIFTISPVRHAREGLVENNRSKALLHTAVHQIIQAYDHCSYFPSYELVLDDLRDYRFYAEDLVHPNYQATQYVWDKFSEAVIDDESRLLMKSLVSIHHAKNHRPLHAGSSQHKVFLQSMLQKTLTLQTSYPFLDLREEIAYFSNT
jgi:hypothetical protein